MGEEESPQLEQAKKTFAGFCRQITNWWDLLGKAYTPSQKNL